MGAFRRFAVDLGFLIASGTDNGDCDRIVPGHSGALSTGSSHSGRDDSGCGVLLHRL